jgi:predicted extracellular nuclease
MARTSVARPSRLLGIVLLALALAQLGIQAIARADTTAQPLPFTEDWSNSAQITTDDDWSGVPGIVGYRGDGLTGTALPGLDPGAVVTDGSGTPQDVNADELNPNTFTTGGIAEFSTLSDPVVAFQGSGTADAPHLVLHLSTTGAANVHIAYNLRDVDGSGDNAVQPVALQYRVGGSGNFSNVSEAFVADATTGPNAASLVTPINVELPDAVADQPLVFIRILTTDAAGSDEWVGIDDIAVTEEVTDLAPAVESTTPADGANDVAVDANVSITFSEAVDVSGTWFEITCTTSGAHTATTSGGSTTFTLDPDVDFETGETCTVTIVADQVSDQDTNDPPDTMAANYLFSFDTVPPVLPITPIHDIQGAAHLTTLDGDDVRTTGIVTAVAGNGFYLQDPSPDASDSTSEGIFVFTSSAPTVTVGDAIDVTGTVDEFRPGGAASTNLTTTEIGSPSVTVTSSGNDLPAATVVGAGGRVPPTEVIEDDATSDVETSGVFDPATDGIDFYESLEGMHVQVNDPVAVGPTNDFGEIAVLADDGAGTGVGIRSARGGIVVRPGDFNPERIIVDDTLADTPGVNTGDHITTPVVGVLDYSFGNFKLLTTSPLASVDEGLEQEVAEGPTAGQLSIATFNVENLDPGDGEEQFADLADLVVNHLRSPDLLTLEEVQDNNGPVNDGTVAADETLDTLVAAIAATGGPDYQWRQIDPVNNADGGEPGGNIRVAFLFRTDRGLTFMDREGGNAMTPVAVVSGTDGPELSISPGRIDPTNAAFTTSRKPLAGEFRWNGRPLFVVANHWNSKTGDEPLFGRFQPPTLASEAQRITQAEVVKAFVDSVLEVDPSANVVIAGDLNDFAFSPPLATLTDGGILHQLSDLLTPSERYSFIFDGNSQQLDHILVSDNLRSAVFGFDFVHVNVEFADQVSDHDPAYAMFGASAGCDIVGTGLDDELVGTDGPDHICGLNGNDTIDGGAGDDFVEGANGGDALIGGDGNDRLVGGHGEDTLVGGPGSDVMHGGNAADVFDASDGFASDSVDGGPGADDCSDVDEGDLVTGC